MIIPLKWEGGSLTPKIRQASHVGGKQEELGIKNEEGTSATALGSLPTRTFVPGNIRWVCLSIAKGLSFPFVFTIDHFNQI